MKLSKITISSSMMVAVNAFIIPNHFRPYPWRPSLPNPIVSLCMESDFGSAMPPKPEQTMEERIEQSATEFIASFTERLAEGVEPPPELEALREARDSGAKAPVIAARIYELMLEQGMLYDVDPTTGIMTPTEWDIKENLEEEAVKKEFHSLYTYGMTLLQRGILSAEEVKAIVKKRLIERTGLTPEEFDKWLGFY